MRYKVIGWDAPYMAYFPVREDLTASVDRAVIEELKRTGYCFGGDTHDFYAPVLNDGTVASYSWRGWGRVMAMARDEYDGGYGYISYYMTELIPEELVKLPTLDYDESKIESVEARRENHAVEVDGKTLADVRAGLNRLEFTVAADDERYDYIDTGDYLTLSDGRESVTAEVIDFSVNISFMPIDEADGEPDPDYGGFVVVKNPTATAPPKPQRRTAKFVFYIKII